MNRPTTSQATDPDSETTAPDGEATAPDSETTAPDGEATAPDGEATAPQPSTVALPRIPLPDPAISRSRRVVSVTTAPSSLEGEGFPVRRAFAGVSVEKLDPFLHLDEMGEVEYAPGEPKGTPWHPHRGFETVTYMIDGELQHADSHGGGGVIGGGDTQWMTAGAGILHIETPPEALVASGGLFHGFQLWVNLPAAAKFAAPSYQAIPSSKVTLLSSGDGGALVRLIAGAVDGHAGPGITATPITLIHATLAPGATLSVPWNADHNALVYSLGGTAAVGADRRPVGSGQLAVLGPGNCLTITAASVQDAMYTGGVDVLLLGGRPIGEPVAMYGPFVMNTREELITAFQDYQSGRLGVIPAGRLPHRTMRQ